MCIRWSPQYSLPSLLFWNHWLTWQVSNGGQRKCQSRNRKEALFKDTFWKPEKSSIPFKQIVDHFCEVKDRGGAIQRSSKAACPAFLLKWVLNTKSMAKDMEPDSIKAVVMAVRTFPRKLLDRDGKNRLIATFSISPWLMPNVCLQAISIKAMVMYRAMHMRQMAFRMTNETNAS